MCFSIGVYCSILWACVHMMRHVHMNIKVIVVPCQPCIVINVRVLLPFAAPCTEVWVLCTEVGYMH